MNTKEVSVAEGKKSFTQLLKEVENEQTTVLIFRRRQLVGAILPPDEYERLERLQAYFEALRLSNQLSHLQISSEELTRESREELEGRS